MPEKILIAKAEPYIEHLVSRPELHRFREEISERASRLVQILRRIFPVSVIEIQSLVAKREVAERGVKLLRAPL